MCKTQQQRAPGSDRRQSSQCSRVKNSATNNRQNNEIQFKSEHRSVARSIVYALTLQGEHAMWQLAATIYARLKPQERAFLALAVLWALTDEEYRAAVGYVEG